MTPRMARGQSVVEFAMALPILLTLFAGFYAACRTAFLASAATSAAQTEALRAGRGLPGIEKQLAAALMPSNEEASVRSGSGRKTRLLPPPLPSLAGRSSGIASLTKAWTETAGYGGIASVRIIRTAEVSADSWNGSSRSGRTALRTIRARIALGAVK